MAALTLGTPLLLQAASPAAADATSLITDKSYAANTVAWRTTSPQSPSYLGSTFVNGGYRVVDVEAAPTNPVTFTARAVYNGGATAAVGGWWHYYNLTQDQVNSALSSNVARPVDIEGYYTSSGLRFAVVMVKNAGAQYRQWMWRWGTNAAGLESELRNTGWRPITVDSFFIGSTKYYTHVAVRNTGADFKNWKWIRNQTTSGVNTALGSTYRVVDLKRNSSSSYDALGYAENLGFWRWDISFASIGAMAAYANRYGIRPIDIDRYMVGSTVYYDAAFVNNLNPTAAQMRNRIYAAAGKNGNYGFYFKQVNGPVLASLQGSTQFEPASTLKALYHLHHNKVRQSATNKSTYDNMSISYRYNPSSPSNGGICPDNFSSTKTTTRSNADSLMMYNSDNRMTRSILELHGKPAMLNTASAIGMTGTIIQHNIGCPTATTHNYTNPASIAKIYETVYKDFAYLNSASRQTFRDRMLNDTVWTNDDGQSVFRWGAKASVSTTDGFCPLVRSIAASLGKSQATADAFCNATRWIAKGGSYGYSGGYPVVVSWSGGSMTSLPFKSSGIIVPRHFTMVDFYDNGTINSESHGSTIGTALNGMWQDAIRPQVRAALLSGW